MAVHIVWRRRRYQRLGGVTVRPTPRRVDSDHSNVVVVVVDLYAAATLRSLMLLDTPSERLVFRARACEGGVTLAGSEDELDGLVGYIAAEANHEDDHRRQRRLDTTFETLNEALTGLE